jgi:hypothetical protein
MKKPDMKNEYVLFSVIFTDKNSACDKIIKEFDNKYGIYKWTVTNGSYIPEQDDCVASV